MGCGIEEVRRGLGRLVGRPEVSCIEEGLDVGGRLPLPGQQRGRRGGRDECRERNWEKR